MAVTCAPSILEEFSMGIFDDRPVEDRYFTKYYICDPDGGDYTFMIHSNKLCVIRLAKTHPIISKNLTVKAVNFQITDQLNRLNNRVTGKGKKGAQLLINTSPICFITCEERSEPYILKSSMVAKLLEVNEALVANPELIKSENLGYIAIISPRVSDHEKQINNLLTEEDYRQKVNSDEI